MRQSFLRFTAALPVLLLLGLLSISANATLPLSSEGEMWTNSSTVGTFIIPTPEGYLLTRQDLRDNLGYLNGLGFNIDRNFTYYSEMTTISSTDFANQQWSFKYKTTGILGFEWIYKVFRPGIDLHVFRTKNTNTFISRVCGNFGHESQNPPPPIISGHKWNDINGDGDWDGGEPPIGGWTIYLKWNGETVRTTATDGNGYYEFAINANAGLIPGIYTLAEEQRNDWVCTHAPGAVEVLEGVPDQHFPNNNFGNFNYGKIYGYKRNDINADGPAGSNPGLPGWTIQLYRDGAYYGSDTTDVNGYYAFDNLPAGTYTVREVMQNGWYATDPASGEHTGIVITSGAVVQRDFYNFNYGKIDGYKRNDIDADGAAGSNPPLKDWTIQLYRNGAYYGSDTTDVNGYYAFDNLPAGTYTVREVMQNGWYATAPASGEHTNVVITSGAEYQRDFYNFKRGKISGIKYEDTHANGAGDGDLAEPSGWTIELWSGGARVAEDTTDANGYYEFTGLAYGTYEVREIGKTGWYPTDPSDGVHCDILITSGAERTRDFYNFEYGSISGQKWEDMNEDGTRQEGDVAPPRTGGPWTIELYRAGEATPWKTMPTDAEGKYRFDMLPHGTYIIKEVGKSGWVQTAPASGSYEVHIDSGTHQTGCDFGNYKLAEISALKWDDSNVDGTQNDIKGTMSGWTIVLYKDGEWFAEKPTGSDGIALFTGLHYGKYTVHERMKDDWRQTTPFPGRKSMPDEGEFGDGSYGPCEAVSGSTWYDLPFGNVQLGSATKIVQHYWWDWLMSGFEVSLDEVIVPELIDNIMGFPVTGTTDEDGSICIDDLLPGRYHFTLALPAGWCEDSVDSDTFDLEENDNDEVVNKVYDNPRREPRTLGFWQNWRLRYSEAEMQVLIDLVKVGSDNFATLSLTTIDSLLSPSNTKKVAMEDMARMQYLALWLNLASQRLGFTPRVDLTPISDWPSIIEDNYGAVDGVMTIHELMKELVRVYNGGLLTRKSDLETFKDICDAVNNYWVFLDPPTGPID
ncbi:MAG: SdrD B-like domain-containing protein [Armatimonadota bacterium]